MQKDSCSIQIGSTRNRKKTIFCVLVIVTLVFSITLAFLGRSESNQWIFFYDDLDTFMDFFNSLIDSFFENPYVDRGVIYPPLTYLIYRFFSHMIPFPETNYTGIYLRTFQPAILSFCLYLVISFLFFAFSLWQFMRKYEKQTVPLLLCVLISAPVLYAFERGNIIILAVSGILVFLAWYESDNAVQRELALIALAFAANIKLFPALFGLLLLNRRHWKDAVRCIIYGTLLFVLPMFSFGGLSNIPVLIKNILDTSEKFERIYESRVDIGNIFRYFSDCNIYRRLFDRLCELTLPLGTLGLSAVSLLVRERWKKILAISLICTAIPSFSWNYNLMYYVPALLCCIYEAKNSKRDYVYFLLLLLIFLYYPFSIKRILPASFSSFFPSMRTWDVVATGCNFLLILTVTADGIYERVMGPQEQILFLIDHLSGQGGNKDFKKICFLPSAPIKKGALGNE